jgi:hypothetical protein
MARKKLGWVCPICETSYSSEAERDACWLACGQKPVPR